MTQYAMEEQELVHQRRLKTLPLYAMNRKAHAMLLNTAMERVLGVPPTNIFLLERHATEQITALGLVHTVRRNLHQYRRMRQGKKSLCFLAVPMMAKQ